MAKKVIYDFMELRDDPADLIDGSDEMLPEADRVTEADRMSPLAGLLRRIQDQVAAEEAAAGTPYVRTSRRPDRA
ncbi:hypothetical protein V5F77_27485 [Xanthobacter sp. DSM 24535]|uniref:hypothetical protein n=1 Tax=Roseixanthobacter psychrophilus TaxID=3119917 RepID=UPI003727F684